MQDFPRRLGAIRSSATILDAMEKHIAKMDPLMEKELILDLLGTIDLMLLMRGPLSPPDPPHPAPAPSTKEPDLPF